MAPATPRDAMAPPRPELWRISDRASFDALRRDGRRARRGPISVTWLAAADPALPPRAGFAVGRAGGAVARNRVRRRLRAALRELGRTGRLPSGTYLVGGGAAVAELPWTDLVATLADAVAAASSSAEGRS